MKPAGSVDTNVLVRLLVQDDEQQTQAVHRLIARHAHKGEVLWVAVSVVLELEWVLRSRYKQPKSSIIQAFSALLASVEFSFESETALEQALLDYEAGNADFGEYLHIALSRHHNALPFWTFDRKAAQTTGAVLME